MSGLTSMRDPSVTALILEALERARPEGEELRTFCPFEQCAGKKGRSFYYNTRKNVWHCHRCNEAGQLHERSMPMSPREIAERLVASEKKKRNTIKSAHTIFEHAHPIQPGDPADRYLRTTRKLEPVFSMVWTSELRYAPRLWHSEAKAPFPGLVAGVRNKNGTLTGVHRFYLTPEGKKANVEPQRKMLGEVIGNSVHLGPDKDEILVAEGIESTLAAMRKLRMVGWAALSASGLAALEIPRAIRRVVVMPDMDRSGVGMGAALTLVGRLLKLGIDASVATNHLPPKGKSDWADE